MRTFHDILMKCIGSQSQIEFAEKIGVSPVTLNRLIKSGNRPSRPTLKKIADVAKEVTSYEELLSACGYVNSPADFRKELPFGERAWMNAEDFDKGLHDFSRGVCIFDSIGDFLKHLEMLYGTEEITRYTVSKKQEYFGDNGAEYYSVVEAHFDNSVDECLLWFILYYAETKGGKFVFVDYAMDGETLAEVGVKTGQKKYCIKVRPVRLSSEERLLRAIFGEGEYYKSPAVGFGFYLEDAEVKDFIISHKDAFCKTIEEKELFEKIKAENSDPKEILKNYQSEETYAEGFQSAVANIMRRETGIPFSYWDDDSYEENRPCIMVPDDYTEFGLKELKEGTEKYAKELGLERYGECMFYQKVPKNTARVFEVGGES